MTRSLPLLLLCLLSSCVQAVESPKGKALFGQPKAVIPRYLTLHWNYATNDPNAVYPMPDWTVFNVYRYRNLRTTNVWSEQDTNGALIAIHTNIYETWNGSRDLIATTTNHYFMIQSTGLFGFFRVTASNTITGLESL